MEDRRTRTLEDMTGSPVLQVTPVKVVGNPKLPTILLFAFLASFLLFTMRGVPSSDGAYFIDQVETLLDDGTLGVEQSTSSWRMREGEDGRYYGTTNEMAMIATTLPFYVIGERVGKAAGSHMRDVVIGFTVTLHSVLFTLIAAWLLVLIAREAGIRQPALTLGVILFVVATPMFVYAGKLYREPLVVAAHLGAVLAFLRFLPSGKARLGKWLTVWLIILTITRLQGAMAMLAVFGGVALYNMRGNRLRSMLAIRSMIYGGVGLVLGYCLLMAWQALFAPGAASASREVADTVFSSMLRDVNGSEDFYAWAAEQPVQEGWWVPLKRIVGMLFSPGKGLVWYGTASIVGLVFMLGGRWRSQVTVQIGVIFFVVYLLAYGLVSVWFSGAWGVRYLMPVLAIPCIYAGTWIAERFMSCKKVIKVLLIALFGTACMTGVVGATVNDRPIITDAPSGVEKITRYDQTWRWEYMPMYFHSRRFLNPSFSVIDRPRGEVTLRQGEKTLLDGYIVWWVMAYRFGVMPLLAIASGILLGVTTCVSGVLLSLSVVRRKSEAI